MKLYYKPGACSLAVRIVLAWLKLPYEPIQMQSGDKAYRAINPLGMVPALEDSGKIFTQAAAILKYLAAKHPEAQLGGDGTLMGEYVVDQWLNYLSADLHPWVRLYFAPQLFTTNRDQASLDQIKAAAPIAFGRTLRHLEKHMENRTFVIEERRTVVDPLAFVMSGWFNYIGGNLADHPHLQRYRERMLQDKEIVKLIEVELQEN